MAGAAATFDCKLKAQSHFITSSTRSTLSQSTDRRSVPWIKHARRERERERERESCSSDKQPDKASGIRANEVKASPSPKETEEVVCAFFFSTVQGFEGSAEVRS